METAGGYAQFFVVNLRGEPLLYRDFLGCLSKDTVDIFYKEVIAVPTQKPPFLTIDGISFIHLRQSSLYFVLTSIEKANSFTFSQLSPSFSLELLYRSSRVLRDFCGSLTEESLRRNVILSYELLDEFFDFGFPQSTNTEQLRPLVHTQASTFTPLQQEVSATSNMTTTEISASPAANLPKTSNSITSQLSSSAAVQIVERKVGEVLEKLGGQPPSTLSVSNTLRPAVETVDSLKANSNSSLNAGGSSNISHKEELFVDLIEKLSAVFSGSGDVFTAETTGTLKMRNFLSCHQAEAVISLSDFIGNVDECNFNSSCVKSDDFGRDRILRVSLPPGETIAMNYRATNLDSLPFTIYPFIDESSPTKLITTIKIHSNIPPEKRTLNCAIRIQVPKLSASVFCETTAGAIEYRREDSSVVCCLSAIQGGVEFIIRIGITLEKQQSPSFAKREIGPIDLSFEIPNWTATKVMIRSVSVEDHGHQIKCFRWTRTLTASNSYTRRLF